VSISSPGKPDGLAGLVVGLIEQNLRRDPARGRHLKGEAVTIEATDAGSAVWLELRADGVRWRSGPGVAAPVAVRAPSAQLLELSGAPLRFGLPDVLTRDGRRIVGGILRGRIRVRGLVRHLGTVRRLTMLLSAR
jgi:hypothetical protein